MDELVKRLRTECTLPFQTLQLMREAADAIEELQKRVPKRPHGRLIDADYVMNNMRSEHPYVQNAIRATIGAAPTIIEAEEGGE